MKLLISVLAIFVAVSTESCFDDRSIKTDYPGNGTAGTEIIMPAPVDDHWQPLFDCQRVMDQVWCIGGSQ